MPQSFRLAVQQLINDCGRHFGSSSTHIPAISADALLNRLETTLNIVEEGINFLSTSSLFSAENTLLSTFRTSLAMCMRTLQYGKMIVLSRQSSSHHPLYTVLVSEEDQLFC